MSDSRRLNGLPQRVYFSTLAYAILALIVVMIGHSGLTAPALGADARAPVITSPAPGAMSFVLSKNPQVVKLFWAVPEQPIVRSISSRDGGRTWGNYREEFRTPAGQKLWGVTALRDRKGLIHMFPLVSRGTYSGDLGLTYFLDIWHTNSKAAQPNPVWTVPKPIFLGYVGAIINAVEMPSGRIVVPFAQWIGGRANGPPIGPNEVTAMVSDDGGRSWFQSNARLTAPVGAEPTTDQVGAVEPVTALLSDGRLWMLIRTQTGHLYQSFSHDGSEWSPAEPSRFFSSDSPAALLKLRDGRILLIWNNCAQPELVDGRGVYGGRDVLHAAISDDKGKTWIGFRQIYLDPLQSILTPNMDRGTSYPSVAETTPGRVVIATGQGLGRRVIISMDVNWLYDTEVEDRFTTSALQGWATFTEYGPALNWNRDRAEGAHVVSDPEKSAKNILRVGRLSPVRPAEGAVWNFPNGYQGTFSSRMMLTDQQGVATISLTDLFYPPTADAGERTAVFRVDLTADKNLNSGVYLQPGVWHSISISWNIDSQAAIVSVDGVKQLEVKATRQSEFGLSYVRFRTSSDATNATDLLVEAVKAKVELCRPNGDPDGQPRKRATLCGHHR